MIAPLLALALGGTVPAAPESLIVETGGARVVLRAADLAALPRHTASITIHDSTHSYRGVRLADVLRRAGFSLDTLRYRDLTRRVVVEAADRYRVALTFGELAPGMGGREALLADTRDGGALPAAEAPWRLVIPRDTSGARAVKRVVRLLIRDESP